MPRPRKRHRVTKLPRRVDGKRVESLNYSVFLRTTYISSEELPASPANQQANTLPAILFR